MDELPKLLLKENPRAFMEIVTNPDPQERAQGLHTFDDTMTCEFLRHGIYNDVSEVPGLKQLYNEFFLHAPVARRKEVYGHVKMIVSNLGGWTAAPSRRSCSWMTISVSFQLQPSTMPALGL